jgi:hypothetical protein
MIRQLAWLGESSGALGMISTLASVLALTLGLTATATRDEVKVTEVRVWVGGARAPWQAGRLTVPDADTTIAGPHQVSHQQLRRYDRHVARLFELTYAQCQKNDALQGMQWTYEVANGNLNLGQFRIRCQTATEVVSGYGLGLAEAIPVTIEGRDLVTIDTSSVPTLNITGTKVENWMRFVKTIRPVRSPLYASQLPTVALRSDQISGERPSEISMVRPRVLPKLSMVKDSDRFVVVPESHGYRICPTMGDSQACDRMRVRVFQSFSARAGGEFSDVQKLLPRDVYRKIDLAQGTPGVYLENCGERSCTSSVQWKRDGMLYEIQAQYRDQPILVAIANSAIAGQR